MSRLSGVHMELVSHQERFNTLQRAPVIVNDYDITTDEDKKALNELLFTEYDGDTLSSVPSCSCGHLASGEYEGLICPECHTEVHPVTERPLESILWLSVPPGIDTFISPAAWRKMTKLLHIPNFDTMTYLTDPAYRWTANTRPIQRLLSLDLPRGLNNFYRHFDKIVEAIAESKALDSKGRGELAVAWAKRHRESVFTTKLPVPSKLVFVVEKSGTGQTMYADLKMKGCIDAIRTISSIQSSTLDISDRVKNSRVVKAIKQLAEFYRGFYKGNISGKSGWLRKAVYGARLDFTGRAVISSKFDQHRYDEIDIPWGLAVELFRLHLTTKLLRQGMTPNETRALINAAVRQYHPRISELLDELLNEAPDGYIPCVLQRNPSLVRASGQKLKITKIRRDPSINTIGFSVLSTKGPNADYDGEHHLPSLNFSNCWNTLRA